MTRPPRTPVPLPRHASAAGVAAGAEQHWRRGLQRAGLGDWAGAASAHAQAAAAAPHEALYHLNHANALRHAGRPEAAAEAARRVLALEPQHRVALRLLAECQQQLHRHAEVLQTLAQLRALDKAQPGSAEAAGAAADDEDTAARAEALLQEAGALMALLRPQPAMARLFQAAALCPADARIHALLSSALRDQGLKREAVECLKTVLALDPQHLEAWTRLAIEQRHVCDWSGLDQAVERITDLLAAAEPGCARTAAVFGLLSLPLAPQWHLAAARGESLAIARGVTPLPARPSPAPRRAGDVPLRVGFLSYDFRDHPVSQLLVEVLERFDRRQLQVHLYSTGPDDGTPLRRRVQAAADVFVDLQGQGDRAAAERIRADGVDILIDLMGHTRGQRLGILAHRPAPVQAGYLGYPGSTGADFIDYLVGDPLVTPLSLAHQYSEKLAQLPRCFLPNGRSRPLPQPMTRAQAGLPEGAFVLCAFNHTYKILPQAFDAWCAALREIPQAVLWLKETNQQLHDNIRREAVARGVDPGRLFFAPKVSYEDHFSRLALADLFVDTWPYGAHTTAADCLWAGLPVVTVYGNSFASRVAAGVLDAAGIGELALADADAYLQAIVALARSPELLAGYRQHLCEQRLQLPLFDPAGYAADFQALLQRIWARHAAGLPPEHLPAEQAASVPTGAPA